MLPLPNEVMNWTMSPVVWLPTARTAALNMSVSHLPGSASSLSSPGGTGSGSDCANAASAAKATMVVDSSTPASRTSMHQVRGIGWIRTPSDGMAQACDGVRHAKRHEEGKMRHATSQKASRGTMKAPMSASLPDLFQPLQLRQLCLANRLVVSPMCQYSCNAADGLATDWHLVHLGSRAVGGAGLILTEAAAVTPEGRISPQDLGFWSDEHAEALDRARRFCQEQGAAIGVQLAHAGRKASTHRPWEAGAGISVEVGGWTPIGPSPKPHAEGYCMPREVRTDEIQPLVVTPFAAAAARAHAFGYDVLEIHAAHGYLLHEFLSPIANHRQDAYGGSFDNRTQIGRA